MSSSQALKVYASAGTDVNHIDERYPGNGRGKGAAEAGEAEGAGAERGDGVPDIVDNAFVVVDFEGGARA